MAPGSQAKRQAPRTDTRGTCRHWLTSEPAGLPADTARQSPDTAPSAERFAV